MDSGNIKECKVVSNVSADSATNDDISIKKHFERQEINLLPRHKLRQYSFTHLTDKSRIWQPTQYDTSVIKIVFTENCEDFTFHKSRNAVSPHKLQNFNQCVEAPASQTKKHDSTKATQEINLKEVYALSSSPLNMFSSSVPSPLSTISSSMLGLAKSPPTSSKNYHNWLSSCSPSLSPPSMFSYIYSRFQMRQLLIGCKVQASDADFIANEVKRKLVDNNCLVVTERKLDDMIFEMLKNLSYPELTAFWYKVSESATRQNIPTVLMLFSSPGLSTSDIAFQLSERLNIPNIVNTQVVADIVLFPSGAPRIPKNFDEWKSICEVVHTGIEGDLEKAQKSQKSVLVEGNYINPEIISDLTNRLVNTPDGTPLIFLPIFLKLTTSANLIIHGFTSSSQDEIFERVQSHCMKYKDFINILEHGKCTSTTVDIIHTVVLDKLSENA